MRALVVVVLLVAACGRAPPKDALDLPLHPTADHGDAGFVDGGAGATCTAGDGCDLACPFLDADCPDGAVCLQDGLCGSGCFDADPDCTPLDDGLRCTFGEECKSRRCTFVVEEDAGVAVCTTPCGAGRSCNPGFACETPRSGGDALCLPASCAAGGGGSVAVLVALLCRGAQRRRSRRAAR